jgi:hypothetical protein
MNKNCLLIPMHPSQAGSDELAQLKAMDIRLTENGKREDYVKKSAERLEKWSNIMFVNMRSSAYIGRAW